MFNNGENYDGLKNEDRIETVIGPSVSVEGTLNSNGNINIEGEFKGTLNVQSKLNIGNDAKLEAEITAENAFIAGNVKGNLNIKDRLELSNSAVINGDVKAGTMIMEAGAVLNGKCEMGKPMQKIEKVTISEETEDSENDD